MGDPVYTSRIRIAQHPWPLRRAHIEGVPEPVEVGAHPNIRHIYRLDPPQPTAASFDLVAAAVGG